MMFNCFLYSFIFNLSRSLINISASMHDANTIFVAVGHNPNFGRYAFSPAALVFPDVSNIPFCSINHDCYCDIPCM